MAASDNLKENYTTVIIHVKDVNDNPPVFERPTYRTQITEEDDRNLPKRVLQVNEWNEMQWIENLVRNFWFVLFSVEFSLRCYCLYMRHKVETTLYVSLDFIACDEFLFWSFPPNAPEKRCLSNNILLHNKPQHK